MVPGFQKKLIAVLLVLPGAVSLLSCQSPSSAGAPTDEETIYFDREAKNVSVPSGYGASAVRSWQVLDDRHLLIETYRREKYVATFASRCPWIRSAFRIGFVTRGPYALDRTTRVVFPDGNTCRFVSLKPFIEPEAVTTPADVKVEVEKP